MDLSLDLTGRVALVTGGAQGVGAGITSVLLAAGARVVTCGRRPADPPAGARHESCDVRDAEDVARLVGSIVAQDGSLDILVNNAGGAPFGLAAELPLKVQSKIIELNLVSPLIVSHAANAVMQQQDDGGAIVNVSSISGVRPSPGTAAYGAAKAGLDHLVRSLAVEWAPKVRVNSIDLGQAHTAGLEAFYAETEGGSEAALADIAAMIPMGRLADPRDVGHLALFLAGPLARHLTGASIELHGGGEAAEFLAEQRKATTDQESR